jgi:hypothetical protein
MKTTEQLNELLSVAEGAAKLRPGPWSVWDSCSWRRIGTTAPYADGDVICPVTQRDGHPDLLAEREVLDHVAAFDPTTCAELVREVMRLSRELNIAKDFILEHHGAEPPLERDAEEQP